MQITEIDTGRSPQSSLQTKHSDYSCGSAAPRLLYNRPYLIYCQRSVAEVEDAASVDTLRQSRTNINAMGGGFIPATSSHIQPCLSCLTESSSSSWCSASHCSEAMCGPAELELKQIHVNASLDSMPTILIDKHNVALGSGIQITMYRDRHPQTKGEHITEDVQGSSTKSPGGVFGPQGESGSEPEDDSQMKFYTEQHRGRRRSKGLPHSPLNKVTLTLITISTCVIAIVYATQESCPLTVKVTLHVPEHFVADGSSFVVSMGSFLDVSNWLNPAKLTLYYQTNSSTQWVLDYCGQRTTEPCEQICDQDTGECSCHEGYSPDPVHKHLCVRSDWGRNEGPWPYADLEKGYDLVKGEQAPERIFRSFYSMGQGLWLPVSKSFVVPPVELSINPIASCKTDVLVTEDPGEVRSV
ncbi:hypothetical protein NQZ68_016646 [Dissostichus eleginoides]|nr:hypothetical protein NQZ68_016646 [Dissostichus eleginoides]